MIVDSNFQKLQELSQDGTDGLVLLGTGGSLNEWVEGVTNSLKIAEVAKPYFKIDMAYKVTTIGGRIDLLLTFDWKKVDVGRLAMWRLSFGDCSWLSDYVVNYQDQHVV